MSHVENPLVPQVERDCDGVPMDGEGHGFIHGSGVDTSTLHNLGTVAAGAQAVFPLNGSFSPGRYEFTVVLGAAITGGIPTNDIYIAPCLKSVGAPADPTTKWDIAPVMTHRRFSLTFKRGVQNALAVHNPAGGATVAVFAHRAV